MVSKEEIYVSIDSDSYRANKLNVLISQADLLGTLKRLQNLKVLARRKRDLKKKILRHLITVLNSLETIQKEIPTSKVPRIIQQREEEIKEPREIKEHFRKRDEIDEELMTIQEKLRELNS